MTTTVVTRGSQSPVTTTTSSKRRSTSSGGTRKEEPAQKKQPDDDILITYDSSINADIVLEPTCFAHLIAEQIAAGKVEISGFAWIDDNNTMRWDCIVSRGQSGSVAYSAEDMNWALEQIDKDVDDSSAYINVQVHTHPGLGVFWSTTDRGEMYTNIDAMADMIPEGSFWYVVYDYTDNWLVRKIVWKKDGDRVRMSYNDGKVTIFDHAFKGNDADKWKTSPPSAPAPTTTYSGYYNYGNHGQQGGWAWANNQPGVYSPPVNDYWSDGLGVGFANVASENHPWQRALKKMSTLDAITLLARAFEAKGNQGHFNAMLSSMKLYEWRQAEFRDAPPLQILAAFRNAIARGDSDSATNCVLSLSPVDIFLENDYSDVLSIATDMAEHKGRRYSFLQVYLESLDKSYKEAMNFWLDVLKANKSKFRKWRKKLKSAIEADDAPFDTSEPSQKSSAGTLEEVFASMFASEMSGDEFDDVIVNLPGIVVLGIYQHLDYYSLDEECAALHAVALRAQPVEKGTSIEAVYDALLNAYGDAGFEAMLDLMVTIPYAALLPLMNMAKSRSADGEERESAQKLMKMLFTRYANVLPASVWAQGRLNLASEAAIDSFLMSSSVVGSYKSWLNS